MQVQNAVEAGNAKAALAKQSSVGGLSQRQVEELESVQLVAQANALAEMEQSHNASQRQLLQEMDMMRQQKAAAEERAIRADYLVSNMKPPPPSPLKKTSPTPNQTVPFERELFWGS